MSQTNVAAEQLHDVLQKLRERGQDDLAVELEDIIHGLRVGAMPEPPDGVITTGEAAAMLGVHSINTIKRWAREGQLEGFQRGGRVLVSRRSVLQLLQSPSLAKQRELERRVAQDLSAFGSDEPPEGLGATWEGRRPWEQGAPARV